MNNDRSVEELFFFRRSTVYNIKCIRVVGGIFVPFLPIPIIVYSDQLLVDRLVVICICSDDIWMH